MGDLVLINQKRVFTLEEAQELLPIVRRLTQKCVERVRKLTTQISYTPDKQRRGLLEKQVHLELQEWHRRVGQVGGEAKGMWLVDFDNGDGYFCWRYPEPNVEFFHSYSQGYQGREKIH